jgi:aminoglycoside 6'-N-acetyltransferase I
MKETMKIVTIETNEQLASCVDLYIEVFNGDPWRDQWTATTAYQRLADAFHSPGFIGLIAMLDAHIAGGLVGNIEHFYKGPYFNLKEMFVRTTLQRQGIGQQLFTALDLQLEERQIAAITLFTSQDFFPSTFYQKHGFHEVPGLRMMSKHW